MELHSILMLLSILLIIFLLTYFVTIKQKRQPKIAHKQEPRFDLTAHQISVPDYDNVQEDFPIHEEDQSSVNLLTDDPLLQPTKPTPSKNNEMPKKTKSAVEEIIFLMLAAQPNRPYVGYELLQALLDAGLRFGAMNIFHRHEDRNGNGKILFSVASASEPGTFEITKMGAFSGNGLMMFLRLSSNKDLMYAFEIMLETAKQLIEDLGGDILDDERKVLGNDKIEKMKKKIQEFEQNQLTGDLFDP